MSKRTNRLFKKTVTDPDTEAALSVVEIEQKQEELMQAEQLNKERLIAQCHEVIGRIQGVKMLVKFGDVASLMWLKDVKEQGIYNEVPGIRTWEKFCEYIGLSQRKVDEDLQNLNAFGQEFMATVASLRVGYRELRKLRQLTHDGDVAIDADFVTIGEEKIPLNQEHSEDLQAAIEALLDEKNKRIEEQHATLRAKDKLLKSKEQLINKQEKEIARHEARAEKAGYTAGEEALIQLMDNARTTIDGFLMQFDLDKNPLPEDATPRMRAKLMHTLDYFKRVILATYDTAADLYGVPDMDDGWVPPHLRRAADNNADTE